MRNCFPGWGGFAPSVASWLRICEQVDLLMDLPKSEQVEVVDALAACVRAWPKEILVGKARWWTAFCDDVGLRLLRIVAFVELMQHGQNREPENVDKVCFSELLRLARSDEHLVLEGEPSLAFVDVAYTIHALSCRKDEPFVFFSCTSVPREIIEPELWGWCQGGGLTSEAVFHKGWFERVRRGTLFLENADVLDESDVTLLRERLEDGEYRRLGGADMVQIEGRLLLADNCKELLPEHRVLSLCCE